MFPASNPRRMEGTNTRPNGVKVVNTFDWIRLDLGNGRGLTSSFGGIKSTGAVPANVFKAWCDANDKGEGPLLDRINRFADDLGTIWPDWNKATDVSRFVLAYKGVWKLGPRKPEEVYEVVAVPAGRSKSFKVRTQAGVTLVNGDFLNTFTVRDAT
jgi:hypothetical protein